MRAEYSYCRDYLIKNGKPWFPVMGEMHYSRYRKEWWEESLRKIKAGGVSVVSAYVIWIHHEEEENVFDFEGCRDIGTFVRLCRKVGLSVFLRIGPFVHGEVRNGGFPDWIIEREKEGMAIRCNNEEYLGYVRRFWKKVYAQVDGCMEKDGGPVIGIQIENEYGHVGGLQGPEGEAHIRTLTAMAKEIGFDVPLYTATGWGGACIGDLLPVMGGYCEAPWDQRTCEIEPNANFVFSHTRNDALIACDHPPPPRHRFPAGCLCAFTGKAGQRQQPCRLLYVPRRQQSEGKTVHPAGEPRDRISERPAGDQLRFQRADPAVRNNLGQLSGDQAAGAVFE